jgi:four helix bundle protein
MLFAMMPYERFPAWRACHELTLLVYRLTARWPKSETYGLTSQSRRAAVSAGVNIAEGTAKRGVRELRRYVDISLGSLSELSYLFRIAHDIGLIDTEVLEEFRTVHGKAGRLTMSLNAALRRRIDADRRIDG